MHTPSKRETMGLSILAASILALSTAGCMDLRSGASNQSVTTITGTEYVTFWSGELRIFSLQEDTTVSIIDLATGANLALTDGRIAATNIGSNPFTLSSAGDAFEGRGGGGPPSNELQVRIESDKPVIVWTGALAPAVIHPPAPPADGVGVSGWASYIPTFDAAVLSNGRELGQTFLGFTTRDMRIIARTDPTQPTSITVTDLVTNTDSDSDDTVTLGPADAVLDSGEIQVFELTGFEDDTVRVSGNVNMSVLVGYAIAGNGYNAAGNVAWSATPPSFAPGDEGIELGTQFYTFARRSLTVFPTQDNTTVTITDLSDGDDSTTVTLANGDTAGNYDLYTTHLASDSSGTIVPRSDAALSVNLVTNNNPIDDDYLKIQADKPILVYVGPVGSNTQEMCDVAFSVPTGPDSRIVYAFGQNFGSSNDLQIFGFSDDTEVRLTSLSFTEGFRNNGQHDFDIGPGIAAGNPSTATASGPWLRGTPGADVWWGSGAWNAEMVRIESNKPITVLNGDYDQPHFGAFIPFVLTSPTQPPTAVATASADSTCPGDTVTLDGTASFDGDTIAGGQPVRYVWDLDIATDADGDGNAANDVDAEGPVVTASYRSVGEYTIQLTFIDDDGQSDTGFVTVVIDNQGCTCPRTQGFWKNHSQSWPVDELLLGDRSYSKVELLAIFGTPVRGDASINLAHQLIAAKLNGAAGAALPIEAADAISQADSVLTGLVVPADIRSDSALGQQMVAVAGVLDGYNNGTLTPDCTDSEEPGPDRTKGNNGVGNGQDPQPPGNPPVNDGPGTGPGAPGRGQ